MVKNIPCVCFIRINLTPDVKVGSLVLGRLTVRLGFICAVKEVICAYIMKVG